MIETPEAAATSPRLWNRFTPFAAPALILLAIVVPFLRFHEYSPLMPESLILMGSAILIGAAVGALPRLRQSLGPLMVAVTLLVYMFSRQDFSDLLVKTGTAVGDVVGYPVVALVVLGVGLFLALSLICVLLSRHLDTIVVAVFGTMIVSTVALPSATGGNPIQSGTLASARTDLPPVVHIILDEHIALAGLPPELPESAAVAAAIRDSYKDFALYTHAYSRFAETKYSLASLMNRDVGPDVVKLLDDGLYRSAPKENDWFETLSRQGYAIKVYQSTWFDMCASPTVDACYTYSFFSPNAVQRAPLSTGQRLRALALKLFKGREALQLEAMVSRETLAQFRNDIAETPRGVAYIVHLLIPHYGYLYSEDCSLLDPSQWEKDNLGEDHVYSAEERADLYHRYLRQVVCANREMESLFTEMRTLGIFDEATIIVHGDHGSRIGERPFITDAPGLLTGEDRIDHYSTLLAIKAPGVAPGLRDEPVALQQIFAEKFLGGSLETSPRPGDVFVRTVPYGHFAPLQFAWPDEPAPDAGQSIANKPSMATGGGG